MRDNSLIYLSLTWQDLHICEDLTRTMTDLERGTSVSGIIRQCELETNFGDRWDPLGRTYRRPVSAF